MPETPAGSHARNRSRSAYAGPTSDSYTQHRSNVHGHAAKQLCRRIARRPPGKRRNGRPSRRRARHIAANLARIRQLQNCLSGKNHVTSPPSTACARLPCSASSPITWEWPGCPGGLLGVTVFFVLSGYLITSLLLIEWDSTGTIDLPQFWLRRVKRLFPAIAFVIIVTAVLCTLFDHSLLTKLREDMWAALCWVTNWWYILRDVSYFDALGAPSPVTHFWSLAIEEQFYVVWPWCSSLRTSSA